MKLFFTIAFAACIATVFAQEGMHIEIMAQAQSNSIEGDYFVKNFAGNEEAMKKEFTFGYQGGVAFGYGFNSRMGLSLGAFYSAQGQHYADYTEVVTDVSHTVKRTTALNYLKIPLHFTFVVEMNNEFSFSAFAGFYFASLLSYTDKESLQYSSSSLGPLFDGTADVSGTDYKWDYNDHGTHYLETYQLQGQPYKKSEFGISAGACFDWRIGDNTYIPLMLTYQAGLTDIKNHSAAVQRYGTTQSYWGDSDSRNHSEKCNNATLGFLIGLKITIGQDY